MAPRSSLFTRSALALTTAATLFASPGFAQQVQPTPIASQSQSSPIDANTNCRERITRNELLGDAKCEILKGRMLDAQGKVLDEALTKKEENLTCLRKVKTLFDDGKVSRETVAQYGRDRACDLLKTLG